MRKSILQVKCRIELTSYLSNSVVNNLKISYKANITSTYKKNYKWSFSRKLVLCVYAVTFRRNQSENIKAKSKYILLYAEVAIAAGYRMLLYSATRRGVPLAV